MPEKMGNLPKKAVREFEGIGASLGLPRFFPYRPRNMIYFSAVSKCPNIHLIVGEDDFLVDAAAKRIVSAAVPEECRGSAVEIVAGAADNRDDQMSSLRSCEASVQTPPFLDPVKLTWWRGITFLPGGGRGGKITDDVKEALEKFAKSLAEAPLPDNQHLLMTAPKLLSTSIFAKTLKSIAEVVVYPSETRSGKRQAAALALLPDLAEDEGISFAPGADQAFIARAGTDTRTIVSELAKLHSYLGEETKVATIAHVAEITSPGGGDPELWDVTDALGARDAARLDSVLSRFADAGKMGVLLSTVVEKFFRELVVYRDALDKGWLTASGWASSMPDSARKNLDDAGVGPGTAKNAWVLQKTAAHARNYTLLELRTARWRLLRAREKLVSSDATFDAVKTELMRIIARRSKK